MYVMYTSLMYKSVNLWSVTVLYVTIYLDTEFYNSVNMTVRAEL